MASRCGRIPCLLQITISGRGLGGPGSIVHHCDVIEQLAFEVDLLRICDVARPRRSGRKVDLGKKSSGTISESVHGWATLTQYYIRDNIRRLPAVVQRNDGQR
jgi:hypothetical protein